MHYRAACFRRISLVFLVLGVLVILGVPSGQAQRPTRGAPAPNDRCGCPQDVAQAASPGDQVRTCFAFDTTGTTAGPTGVDVIGGFPSDVWFRLPGPHCPGKTITSSALGNTFTPSLFLVTEGGGMPFFVCDVTCDDIAGNPFFDSDVVIADADGQFVYAVPASQAGRDFYFLVNAGGGGFLQFCVTTTCPR